MFKKLREDTEKRLLKAEENIKELKNNSESKEIIEKFLSLDKQFLHGIFDPVILSFDSIENIEHNYCVLYQHIFDDNFIYIQEKIHPIEKSMKDRLNAVLKTKGEPEQPYTTHLKPNLREDGTVCDILKFIDASEKKEIERLNSHAEINRKRGLTDFKTDFYNLNKFLSGFDKKNIDLLDIELKGLLCLD